MAGSFSGDVVSGGGDWGEEELYTMGVEGVKEGTAVASGRWSVAGCVLSVVGGGVGVV